MLGRHRALRLISFPRVPFAGSDKFSSKQPPPYWICRSWPVQYCWISYPTWRQNGHQDNPVYSLVCHGYYRCVIEQLMGRRPKLEVINLNVKHVKWESCFALANLFALVLIRQFCLNTYIHVYIHIYVTVNCGNRECLKFSVNTGNACDHQSLLVLPKIFSHYREWL